MDEQLERFMEEERGKPLAYFPHDADAFEDDSLYQLWEEEGYEGYGKWWRLCELLADRKGHGYPVRGGFGRLAYDMRLEVEECERFIRRLLALHLLSEESLEGAGMVRSKRMMANDEYAAEQRAKRRLGAAKTNAKRWSK